jgi:hypothetical protein
VDQGGLTGLPNNQILAPEGMQIATAEGGKVGMEGAAEVADEEVGAVAHVDAVAVVDTMADTGWTEVAAAVALNHS